MSGLTHIGVASMFNRGDDIDGLKRHALFFDEIQAPDLRRCRDQNQYSFYGQGRFVADIDFLEEIGFLKEYEFSALPNVGLSEQQEKLMGEASREFLNSASTTLLKLDRVKALFDEHGEVLPGSNMRYLGTKLSNDVVMEMAKSQWRTQSAYSRLAALNLRSRSQVYAVSLDPFEFVPAMADRVTDEDLLRVVIQQVPVPAECVPWQDILAFKADADSKRRLQALRLWCQETASGNITLAHAAEKVASLLDEYQHHAKSVRFNTTLDVVEAILTAAPAAFENLLKLRFGKLASMPFYALRYRAKLLEEERAAPGYELSYVVSAADFSQIQIR